MIQAASAFKKKKKMPYALRNKDKNENRFLMEKMQVRKQEDKEKQIINLEFYTELKYLSKSKHKI